jgi:Flp pilus assembly protein TadG
LFFTEPKLARLPTIALACPDTTTTGPVTLAIAYTFKEVLAGTTILAVVANVVARPLTDTIVPKGTVSVPVGAAVKVTYILE